MTWSNLLFVALPYAALALFLVGAVSRYRKSGFTVSALSSQFLESRTLFWGSVPFHFGILALLVGHLVAFLIPDAILFWNRHPVRLLVLESAGVIFGVCVLWGLGVLLVRRVSSQRVRAVTSTMDLVIELVLLVQVVLGLWTALQYRWGSSWFAGVLSPYLWSLLSLQPDFAAVEALPLVIRLHIIGAFVILGLFPFTRLIHILVAPLHYIPRRYQQVMWYWNRKRVRDPETEWGSSRPRNT